MTEDALARAVHGAPAQALADALAALARLSRWIAWTADGDLPPDGRTGARNMRKTAAVLAKASAHLGAAADPIDPPDPSRNELLHRGG